MPATYMAPITEALACSKDVAAIFAKTAQAFQAEVGYKLLTISSLETTGGLEATRVWSSNLSVFPIGGMKQIDNPEWIETVMGNHQTLVCQTPDALRRLFNDHADLESIKCGSGINLPLILADEVIGVVNVFHESSWFTNQRIEDARAIMALMYAPMILQRSTPNYK